MALGPMIAWHTWLPAPAKLNLFLHVVGRRADGYHELQTAFRLIDLADRLRFAPRADGAIVLDPPLPGVDHDHNLIVRAARALQAATGTRAGATIELEKVIPMGGGLGGGSSDAATTLIALAHLWNTDLDRSALARIGLALGADVPVFVHGANAFAEGVGEQLTPITLPARWYVIVVPPVAVPTAAVFADPALTRDTERTTMAAFFAGQSLANDLEPVVRRRYPEVVRCLHALEQASRVAGAIQGARMSGSGSCVFAEFPTEAAARVALERLEPGMHGIAVRGLDHHPLAEGSGTERTLGSRQVG